MTRDLLALGSSKLCLLSALALCTAACNTRVYVEGAGEESGEGEGEGGWDDPEIPEEPEEPEWPDESCGNGVVDPGEFCHELQTTIPSGIDPCALAVADFDHDGMIDTAVPNSDFVNASLEEHVAHVMMGQGNGNLLTAVAHHAGAPFPVGIASGDFDGDGNADLATANYDSNEINLLYGDGAGGFSEPTELDIGASADTISAGDMDHDGITDLVVTTGSQNALGLIRNHPDGPGPVDWYALGNGASHAELADVDHDGNADLVIALSFSGFVHVALGDGAGGFGPSLGYAVNYGPSWVFVDDMDEDGHPDLLVANQDGTADVLRGDGDGGFAEATNLPMGNVLQSITAADFDMDGHLDLAVSDEGQDSVVFAVGVGQEGISELYTIWTGSRPVSIRRADFNNDGVMDVAVANQYSNSVSVIVSNP